MLPRFLPGIDIDDIIIVLEDRFDNDEQLDKLSSIFGGRKFYLVSSGRSAIYLALKGLGVSRGDEVIVPALTCPAVIDAVIALGATPVVVPIERERFGLDPSVLNKAINRKTKVILPTDIYGARCRMEEIAQITNGRAVIIEDSAQSSPYDISSWSDNYASAIVISLNYDKHITVGGGGILVLNKPNIFKIATIKSENNSERSDILSAGLLRILMERSIYDRFLPMTAGSEMIENALIEENDVLRILHNYVDNNKSFDGIKEILTNLTDKYLEKTSQSDIVKFLKKGLWHLIRPVFSKRPEPIGKIRMLGKLKKILVNISLKRFHNDAIIRKMFALKLYKGLSTLKGIYIQNFKDDALLRFTVSFIDRSKAILAMKRLTKVGIEVGPFNYPMPIHKIHTYRKYIRIIGDMRQTEILVDGIVNIPVHEQVSDDDIDKISEIIRGVVSGRERE